MHPLFFAVINTLKQFAWIVGTLFIAGWVIGWLARCINSAYASFVWPRFGLYLFGLVGIPAHEFSHWIFCKLFRLKVNRVKWFDAAGKGGAHGMVEHQFDPGNPVHRFAHLFIGLAPILLLPLLIVALFYFLYPGATALLHQLQAPGSIHAGLGSSLGASAAGIGQSFIGGLISVRALIFIYLAFALVAHMDLSREDLKVASSGLPVLFFLLLVMNVGSVLIGWNANALFFEYGRKAWYLWAPTLGICLALSLMHLLVAWAVLGFIHFVLRRPPIRVLP